MCPHEMAPAPSNVLIPRLWHTLCPWPLLALSVSEPQTEVVGVHTLGLLIERRSFFCKDMLLDGHCLVNPLAASELFDFPCLICEISPIVAYQFWPLSYILCPIILPAPLE